LPTTPASVELRSATNTGCVAGPNQAPHLAPPARRLSVTHRSLSGRCQLNLVVHRALPPAVRLFPGDSACCLDRRGEREERRNRPKRRPLFPLFGLKAASITQRSLR